MRIDDVVNDRLCSSCGVCVSSCPQKCIKMLREMHSYYPSIDESQCIDCGVCYETCSRKQMSEYDGEGIESYLLGSYKDILSVQSYDENILNNATSGGVVTSMIKTLLEKDMYEAAFCVEGYSYEGLLCAKAFEKGDDLYRTQKSRYLLVSHEYTADYICHYPNRRVIIIAVPCAIQALLNMIEKRKLKRENYLFIGLFCDKTMNYGVVEYFSNHPKGKNRSLRNLYFRTKESGGWPGNVRIEYEDGTKLDLPKRERIKVKDYFMPERCLYCLDKLNRKADVSVGDNYIGHNADSKGNSSVIIRTPIGERAWLECKSCFRHQKSEKDEFIKSQHLEWKLRNYDYACLKGIYSRQDRHIPWGIKWSYRESLRKISLVKAKNLYVTIDRDVKLNRIKNLVKKIGKTILTV